MLAIALVAGIGLGWWYGRNTHAPIRGAIVNPVQTRDARAASANESDAHDLRIRPAVGDNLGSESTRALKDPAYLRTLLQRYATETDLDRKGALLAVLGSAANDDVLRFALDRVDSRDPQVRSDALALLAAFPLDRAEVRDTLMTQLRGETDPLMQARLIGMLAPVLIPSEDAAPIVRALAALHESTDPDVRAASVLQSAQWDTSAGMEDALHRALLDREPQVRQAAIAGVAVAGIRSDRIKDSLLATLDDATLPAEERQAAVMSLQGFSLDRAEFEVYRNAAESLHQDDEH